MKTRTRFAPVALAAAVALVLSACSGGTTDTPESPDSTDTATTDTTDAPPARGGTLTLGLLQEPASWDAAQAHVGHRLQPFQAAYDSLILREPDGSYSPMLATEWGFTDDLTFTMTLRTDVTFSDGTPFDAEAVKANIEHFQQANGPQASQAAAIASVTVTAPDAVEITLSEPDPSLEYYFSQALGLMSSPAAQGTEGIDRLPVGTGPYTMVAGESVVGSQYVFEARADYWNPELQHFDRIVMKYLSDVTARVNGLVSGEIDAGILDGATMEQAEASGMTLLAYPTDWSGLLLFDRDGALNPEMADVRVRQAINHALDREALLQQIRQGYGTVTGQVFGPESSAYVPELDTFYAYDVEKARALMADAGYADGFTLRMPMLPDGEATMTFVRQQLSEIGITVELNAVPVADYQGELGQGNYGAAWFSLFQGPTWVAAQQLLSDTTLYNPFRTTTTELEGLLADVLAAGTDDAAAAQALNRYVTEQAWFAPWYRPDELYMFDPQRVHVVPQVQQAVPSIYNYTPAS